MVTGPKQPEGQPGAAERGGVSRRKLLRFTGVAGLTAALAAACSGNSRSKKSTERAEPGLIGPLATPSSSETTKPPFDMNEIVSLEEMCDVFTLPNFNKMYKDAVSDEAARDRLISRFIKMVNYWTNPNLFNTRGEEVEVPSMAYWCIKEIEAGDIEYYGDNPRLSEHVAQGFREYTVKDIPQYEEEMNQAITFLRQTANVNTRLAVVSDPDGLIPDDFKSKDPNGSGQIEPVTEDKKEFRRLFSLQSDGVSMSTEEESISIGFTTITKSNIATKNHLSNRLDFNGQPTYWKVLFDRPDENDYDTPLRIMRIGIQTKVNDERIHIGD